MIQVKSYHKECKTCTMEGIMSNESVRWRALETDYTTSHVCRQVTPSPPMSSLIHRLPKNLARKTLLKRKNLDRVFVL